MAVNDTDAKYRELGTLISGYSESGPFSCANCIHKTAPDAPNCVHPAIIGDFALADRVVEANGQRYVTINLEKGCCRFVRPPGVIALILRHGDTLLNEEGRLRSLMDININEEGQAQAIAARDFILANFPTIARIVTTPLQRTQQTVAPIAEALGLVPEIDPAIITWNMGVLIGQKRDEVKDVMEYFVAHPDEPIPKGESLQQVATRLQPAIEDILHTAEEEGIALICMTSSMIITLLKLIEGRSLSDEAAEPGIGPGGIMAITLNGDGYDMAPIFGETKPAEIGAS